MDEFGSHRLGWEDLDLLFRLQLLTEAHIERAGGGVRMSHGDEQRSIDGVSRASNEALNASMCLANYGLCHYSDTYEDDVAKWSESNTRLSRLGAESSTRP